MVLKSGEFSKKNFLPPTLIMAQSYLLCNANVLSINHDGEVALFSGNKNTKLLLIFTYVLKYTAVSGEYSVNDLNIVADIKDKFILSQNKLLARVP